MSYPKGSRYPPISAEDVTEDRLSISRLPAGTSGYVIQGQGAAADPAYAAAAGDMLKSTYDSDLDGRIEANAMEWTLAKILRGAGAAANPTEIDVPVSATAALDALYFGNGADGDVTITADTDLTTGNLKFYNNLTVNTGINLTANPPFVIYVKGTLTLNGTIHCNAKSPTGGAGGTNASGGGSGGAGGAAGGVLFVHARHITGSGTLNAGGGNGSNGADGPAGTAVANGGAGAAGTKSKFRWDTPSAAPGSGGGGASGGQPIAGGAGGSGGTTLGSAPTECLIGLLERYVMASCSGAGGGAGGSSSATTSSAGGGGGGEGGGLFSGCADGGAGGGSTANAVAGGGGGGGGGGAGGFLIVLCPGFVATVTLQANGGNGGNGGNAYAAGIGRGGGGGAGSGGALFSLTGIEATTKTVAAGSAGLAGAGTGNGGVNGAAGSTGLYLWHKLVAE